MIFYCIFLFNSNVGKCVFIFQANESLILKAENSVQVTEDTIINLSKGKKELTDLWAVWNFKINQVKPIKQQCLIFEEQLTKVSKKARKQLRQAFLDCYWFVCDSLINCYRYHLRKRNHQ